ncbi:hypothetical protein Q8A73_015762 [Channa argus]|nr:hypothetical protein Q8A73_015762 [Channa argus]
MEDLSNIPVTTLRMLYRAAGLECSSGSRCGHVSQEEAIVKKSVAVRLAGPTRLSGRAEIYYNNIWGKVCENGWDINDASVVCRESGYEAADRAFHLVRSRDDDKPNRPDPKSLLTSYDKPNI